MNAFHTSVRDGDIIGVMLLLHDEIYDVNVPDQNGMTPLHYACFYIRIGMIRTLVRAGANVNARDNDGRTPLLVACYFMNFDCIDFLIKNGADLNICDNNGCSPLHHASCHRNKVSCIKLLTSSGIIDINKQDILGCTPLHHAVSNGVIENVRCLIDCGASIYIKDKTQRTAIEKCFNPEMKKLLLDSEIPEIKEPEEAY